MCGTASASAPATGSPSSAIPCHREGKHRFGSLRPRRDQRHCRRRHCALDRTATAQQIPSGSDHIHSIYDTSAHRMRASISPPIRVTRTSCRQPQPYSRITRSCAVLTIQRSCIPRLRILLEPNGQGGGHHGRLLRIRHTSHQARSAYGALDKRLIRLAACGRVAKDVAAVPAGGEIHQAQAGDRLVVAHVDGQAPCRPADVDVHDARLGALGCGTQTRRLPVSPEILPPRPDRRRRTGRLHRHGAESPTVCRFWQTV